MSNFATNRILHIYQGIESHLFPVSMLARKSYSSSGPVRYIPGRFAQIRKAQNCKSLQGSAKKGAPITANPAAGFANLDGQRLQNSRFDDEILSPNNISEQIGGCSGIEGLDEPVRELFDTNYENMDELNTISKADGDGFRTTREEIEQVAVGLLAGRAMTAIELRKKLRGKKYSFGIVECVVTDFKSRGLLNDSMYAESFTRSRWLSSTWGPRRIKQENFTTFTDMKRVWVAKKFSYIYEASPRSKSAFFLQSLFSHSIGHMTSSTSLSQRLGGLYCLYCLYETQPYKPCAKIYLCLGELKSLKLLVVDAKQNGILVVPALVKKMLTENMLLFGSSDSGLSTQRVDAAKKLEDNNLQIAYEKLLFNTEIEDYIHMNLGLELGLDSFKKMSTEYVKAKEEAIKEASNSVGMEDVKHIVEGSSLATDMVEKLVEEWDSQKESFYKQIGISNRDLVSVDAEGFAEVERLLDE